MKDEILTRLIKQGHITLDEAMILRETKVTIQPINVPRDPYKNPMGNPYPPVAPHNPLRNPYTGTGDTPWKQGIWYDNSQQFTC